MKTLRPESVGEALRRIYDARIPGRIEWMFDDGFVWVLVGRSDNGRGAKQLPRLWLDDEIAGVSTVAQTDIATHAQERSRLLQRDWLRRGRERSFEGALSALADAIVQHYPESEFVRWWREQPGGAAL